ncbi:hypothetical protein A0J61_10995 [Choanephora cucurbitarum]|uniref:Uncharacterized protein n=1 Tax=Choanephora cucurbitarum TaxID=101091 RepID=A0A1C7MWX5_9FUNG|nr:hypothetical protein A0J61_10995 [Choanephora cucurbitarum]
MDYSASPSHWLFNFERYNQDLKTIRTNRKDCVERTYMTKFLMQVHGQEYSAALLSSIPQENRKQVQEMFSGVSNSCADLLLENYHHALNSFCLTDFNNLATGTTFAFGSECLPRKTLMSIKPVPSNLSADAVSCLIDYYNSIYGLNYINEYVSLANPSRIPVEWQALKFKSVDILGNKYHSMEALTKNKRGSYAVGLYQDETGKKLRYCQMRSLFRHAVLSNLSLFFNNHQDPDLYGMEMMQSSFEADSHQSIIPVSSLYAPVAVVLNHIDNSHVVLKLSRKVIS